MKKLVLSSLIVSLLLFCTVACSASLADHFQNGVNLDNQQLYDEAISEYTQAIEASQNLESAYLNRGNDYMRKGEFDLAIGDFDKAVQLNPSNESGFLDLGIALLNKGFKDRSMLSGAIVDFSRALAINPNDAVAYHNRGYAYALEGKTDLAISDLKKAIQLSSDPATVQHAEQLLADIGQGRLSQAPAPGAQVWELTESERHQMVKVIVEPYTYTGTFTETSDSPGWWIFDSAGNALYRLPVGGNIFHSSQGDSWEFVNFGNAGGGYQTLGRGQGTENGSFPAGDRVEGDITFTTQSRLGSVTGTVKWSGEKLQ